MPDRSHLGEGGLFQLMGQGGNVPTPMEGMMEGSVAAGANLFTPHLEDKKEGQVRSRAGLYPSSITFPNNAIYWESSVEDICLNHNTEVYFSYHSWSDLYMVIISSCFF